MELGGYQVALEEVLTWLLAAEDKVNVDEPVADNLDDVKIQFKNHEVRTYLIQSRTVGFCVNCLIPCL